MDNSEIDCGTLLDEYSSEEAIKTYTKKTAGEGINYLMENVYGPLYLDVINDLRMRVNTEGGLRILEFGCGGGMNLIHLVNLLTKHNIQLDIVYGTDFSKKLIDAAKIEAKKYLNEAQLSKVKFFVASNENLHSELSENLKTSKEVLSNSFHLVFGVNTFRYCHRSNKEKESSKNIFDLLVKGGSCIMIEMNTKFPFFRSRFRVRDVIKDPGWEFFLPTLAEYVNAFEASGFEILNKTNFCWIPHSAQGMRFKLCKLMSPILDKVMPGCGMRSLVISRKPL